MSQRILICGSRNWANYELIVKALSAEQDVEIVIEGGASGADAMGRQAAVTLGIPYVTYFANWGKHGRAAGPIRNQTMLDEGKPTKVLAFHPYIDNSKGTKDMVKRAILAGVPVITVTGREKQ